MGTLTNSEDPDEMQHNAAFYQGLHCLPRVKQPSDCADYLEGTAAVVVSEWSW